MTSAELPLRERFGQLAVRLAGYFSAVVVTIATADETGVHIEYALEDGAERPPNNLLLDLDPATAAVVSTGAPVAYLRAEDWPPGADAMTAHRPAPALESALFVPILFVGSCIGVLSVQSRERDAYDERDTSLLEACALYVGAWLYDQRGRQEATRLERIASTDALTGLANRRAFDEAFSAEWRRCRRHGLALSLLLLDVDFFKSYNDEYGHVPGDRCLRDVARAIAACAKRPGDITARYGGEEFAVVLPGADAKGAITVGESIRSAIAALAIPHHGSSLGYVSVSIGASTVLAADTFDADEFLRRADEMLYAAKKAGRNRVVAQGYGSHGAAALPRAEPASQPQQKNLPLQVTTFIGRAGELREASYLLAQTRLLTLVGTGGVGKTRMALRIADEASERFADGTWFVDLSPLTDGQFVPVAALSAMEIDEPNASSATAVLLGHLKDRSALIVQDNCEHVISAAADAADCLFARDPAYA